VGFPIFTHVKAVMGADQFEVCIIDIIKPVLVIRFIHTEDPKVCEKREKAESGNGSCNGDCIMFLDSSLEEMVRKLFCKACCFYGRCRSQSKTTTGGEESP
jgi:hypothetical protein